MSYVNLICLFTAIVTAIPTAYTDPRDRQKHDGIATCCVSFCVDYDNYTVKFKKMKVTNYDSL